jgi:hypothetical protein
MADENEVVELGPATNASFADGGAVNAGIGLDFDVVFQHGRSGLMHLVPASVLLVSKAKAISTNDGTVL